MIFGELFRPWLLLLCLPVFVVSAAVAQTGVAVGEWIWDAVTQDRQACRFVRAFEIPADAEVDEALIRITADNSYRLYLNGRVIGQGGDWRAHIEYDVTRLLGPGRHLLAVEAVNDFDVAGLIAGLRIELRGGGRIEILSDASWRIAPPEQKDWAIKARNLATWPAATVISHYGTEPNPPVYRAPALLPEASSLWARRWFQLTLLALGLAGLAAALVLAGLLVLKSQAERVVRRERARIAGDLHDNLGGGLTRLLLLGEGARREAPPEAEARLGRLCDQARELMQGMNETVWLINSQRDTVRDLAGYLARYAEMFLRESGILCRFEIDPDLPAAPCDLGVRRNLFLAVKEVLNNIVRHAAATEVELVVRWRREVLWIGIRDNGRGFDPAAPHAGDGLRNLALRAGDAGGRLVIDSRPGGGSRVEFEVPLAARRGLGWARWRGRASARRGA